MLSGRRSNTIQTLTQSSDGLQTESLTGSRQGIQKVGPLRPQAWLSVRQSLEQGRACLLRQARADILEGLRLG